jgi:hypothetical protein
MHTIEKTVACRRTALCLALALGPLTFLGCSGAKMGDMAPPSAAPAASAESPDRRANLRGDAAPAPAAQPLAAEPAPAPAPELSERDADDASPAASKSMAPPSATLMPRRDSAQGAEVEASRDEEAAPRAREMKKEAAASAGPRPGSPSAAPSKSTSDKGGKGEKDKDEKVTTWKRAGASPNSSRLMIGDKEELPLKGMQSRVQLDGFRARVVLDYFFMNDRGSRYEGTFKLRLPNGASPYFFAFGETVFKSAQGEPTFLDAKETSGTSPKELMFQRQGTWTAPKEARMVPKE